MKLQYLEAGEIVTTHGVRGEMKVLPWADSPEFLLICITPQHSIIDSQRNQAY